MSEDDGFFGGLVDSIFGDDEDTPVPEPARPPTPAPAENMSVDPDQGGMSFDPDEGGMSVDDNGDTGEFGTRVAEDDDAGMSVDPNDGGMSIDPNEGGMSVDPGAGGTASASSGPNMSMAPAMDLAEDICLWPHSIIQLIDLALGNESVNTDTPTPLLGGSFEIHRYDEYPLPNLEFKYFEVKSRALLEVAGKWTPVSGVVTAGYDQGVVLAIQSEFKSDDGKWGITPKLKLGFPVQQIKDKTQTVGIAVGFEAAYFTKCKEIPITISLEILAAVVEFERPDKNAKWKTSWANLEMVVSGAATGSIGEPGGLPGAFEGTLKISGKVVVEPNWEEIIKQAMLEFGKDLTFDAVVTAGLSVAIVAGGVATIVIGVIEILDTWELMDMRDVIIPERSSAGTKGYLDGLHGRAPGKDGIKLTSAAAAYDSSAALGKKQRAKLIAEKCDGDASIFDRWLADHEKEVEAQARGEITVKMQRQLFQQKAAEYAGSLRYSDTEKLQNQYYAWIYIIGNSPVSKGGSWLTLWTSTRIADPSHPDRTAGNW